MNSDFKSLLSILNAHNVRYLVVGGYAVMKYTEPRYTKDLDIWIDASLVNAQALFTALREFGAPLTNLSPSDFAGEGSIYQMGRPPVRVDIFTSIEGVRFDAPAHLISCEDLLLNKRTVGRPQDLLDVSNLMEAQKTLEGLKPQVKPKKKSKPKGLDKENKS